MRIRGGSAHLCAAIAAFSGASLIAMAAAQAGGFAVREQSAYYQGMSFAGAGAGDTLSSMFWNSAAAASVDGFNTESHASVVFPGRQIEAEEGVIRKKMVTARKKLAAERKKAVEAGEFFIFAAADEMSKTDKMLYRADRIHKRIK